MAIKSKNFKTSFGLKLVAFFVAALLAFSSAICAVEAINDLFRYGSEILTKPAKYDRNVAVCIEAELRCAVDICRQRPYDVGRI